MCPGVVNSRIARKENAIGDVQYCKNIVYLVLRKHQPLTVSTGWVRKTSWGISPDDILLQEIRHDILPSNDGPLSKDDSSRVL